jgi:hypothetical protein
LLAKAHKSPPQLIDLPQQLNKPLNKMKLYLLLLPSLFHLSRGFMAELRGPLTDEACTGEEYADFRHCAAHGVETDQSLPALNEAALDDMAFINHGHEDDRRLNHGFNWCSGCTGGAPRGTFCFTVCGGRRRLSEKEGTMDTPNLRRLDPPEFVAVFENGEYTGNGQAKQIAKAVMECLENVSTKHPCLGSTDTMVLTVTL